MGEAFLKILLVESWVELSYFSLSYAISMEDGRKTEKNILSFLVIYNQLPQILMSQTSGIFPLQVQLSLNKVVVEKGFLFYFAPFLVVGLRFTMTMLYITIKKQISTNKNVYQFSVWDDFSYSWTMMVNLHVFPTQLNFSWKKKVHFLHY